MRARPQYVIFDLDGTLADSSVGIVWSFRSTLERIGISADEEQLHQLIGPPLGESFRALGVADSDIDSVVEVYRGFYAERGVHEAHLYDDVDSTLETLKSEGVRLAVATAKRVDFARQMLGDLGVADFFDEIRGASVDLSVTSKYDIMSQVLSAWDVDRKIDVWMVGDRHYDMVAARAHDVSAVGARWGFGSDGELLEAGAHWLVAQPTDLLDLPHDAGSPVCLMDEVCDVCGAVLDATHPRSCRGPTPAA